MDFALLLARALEAYLVLGALFAVPFVIWGVARVDPVAKEGTLGFRLLLLPGCAALWPLLLARWVRGGGGPAHGPAPHGAHGDGAEHGGQRHPTPEARR